MRSDEIDLGTVSIPRLFRIYLIPTLLGMLSLCAVTATDGIWLALCVSEFLTSASIIVYYLLRRKIRH